jgi:hypothetical protein
MPVPTGIGLYLRALKIKTVADARALGKKFSDNGLSWVAVAGPWHDRAGERWMNPPATVQRALDGIACCGIGAHVWGYPWWDRVEKFVDDMCLASGRGVGLAGWLLDPELGLKGHTEEATRLFRQSRAALDAVGEPSVVLGLTSYGLPRGHRNFPFAAFGKPGKAGRLLECDYGSPQLYDVPAGRVLEGLADYAKIGFDTVVPSFGCYRFVKRDPGLPLTGANRKAVPKTPEELEAHLMDFVRSPVPVRGMIGWAENFVGPGQWRVLARWAELLRRGAGALPA